VPVTDVLKLIERAIDEEEKEQLYRLWLAKYPLYDKETFETFNEFYDKCKPKKITYDQRDKDDIMTEILERNSNGTI